MPPTENHLNIVIPSTTLSVVGDLLSVASGLLTNRPGQSTLVSIVEVPEERSLSEGALVVRRRRSLLRKAAALFPERNFGAEVRTARSTEQGIRDAVADLEADLLLVRWRQSWKKQSPETFERLLADPPCDVAVVKPGPADGISRVLVPARGGPHARLALHLAESLAREHEAVLTLLHVVLPHWTEARREKEGAYFEAIRADVSYTNVRALEVEAESVEAALLAQESTSDLVVMGSAARDEKSPFVLGSIPETVARKVASGVIIVKTREPVTAQTFGLVSKGSKSEPDISGLVDRWFAENTFHSHEFRHLAELVALKERAGNRISLALPTLNEEATVGKIISTIQRRLMDEYPLVDELIVIDSNSQDRTVQIASDLGIPVFRHPEILPECGAFEGKGEALWKSLQVTSGDIVVWVDSDITGFHPKFVYGLLGPLLTQPRLGFVKGFYRRPLKLGGELLTTGGGRVTELTARPLINLFYPELSGLVQPLAGEMAGRRELLASVPFFTGYGVETGLLIDILEQFGMQTIAQTDLEERVHRNQTLLSLSKMAFAIVQVVIKRLGDRQRLQLQEEMNSSMKLIHYAPSELFLEVKEIREHERPPINTLEQYQVRHCAVEPAPVRAG